MSEAPKPHEYTLSTETQRIVDAAREAPQWDTAHDKLTPSHRGSHPQPERHPMMSLEEALAEVKRVTPADQPWAGDDLQPHLPEDAIAPIDHAIATILNATAFGDLIKRTDAEQAVALAYQRAGDVIDGYANSPRLRRWIAAEMKAAILALADAAIKGDTR